MHGGASEPIPQDLKRSESAIDVVQTLFQHRVQGLTDAGAGVAFDSIEQFTDLREREIKVLPRLNQRQPRKRTFVIGAIAVGSPERRKKSYALVVAQSRRRDT